MCWGQPLIQAQGVAGTCRLGVDSDAWVQLQSHAAVPQGAGAGVGAGGGGCGGCFVGPRRRPKSAWGVTAGRAGGRALREGWGGRGQRNEVRL